MIRKPSLPLHWVIAASCHGQASFKGLEAMACICRLVVSMFSSSVFISVVKSEAVGGDLMVQSITGRWMLFDAVADAAPWIS